MDIGGIPLARLPQCLERVGDEEDLKSLVKHNRDPLMKVRIVFLHGREAALEAALECKEVEDALKIEHGTEFDSARGE